MQPSLTTGASAAGAEGDSPTVPSTPWAELDPGEQGAERFDRLGNRVLEDSSDEEDRERQARDGLLDDENTEVAQGTYYAGSCVCGCFCLAGAAQQTFPILQRLRRATVTVCCEPCNRLCSTSLSHHGVSARCDLELSSVVTSSVLSLETPNHRRLRLCEGGELTLLPSCTTWGSPSGRRRLKFLKGSACQRCVSVDSFPRASKTVCVRMPSVQYSRFGRSQLPTRL